ncbi:MAG: GntR family transcriptional regulator, partial [Opitutaceae bacterium]|nr:GntR family transcriptional regulator [Opitutaceae bacterium]
MALAQQKVEFVYATLARRIRTGFWRTGEVIPAEIDLAAEFRCSRGTVNRAVSQLAREGRVERRTRAGTRVRTGGGGGGRARKNRGERGA